jgi:hypothetical protein
MTRITAIRLTGAVALCLCSMMLGGVIHLPAMAATEYRQYIAPMFSSTCSSTSPCLTETNSKSGAGVKGISNGGNGSVGQTKFNSTSPSNGAAGVFGQDVSTSGAFDSGVLGTSTNGIGVQGKSVNGYGVVAVSANQSALFVENTGFSDGIQSIALHNDGTNSSTQNASLTFGVGRSGMWGHDDSTDGGHLNAGVAGSSTNGIGVSGSSTNYVGVNAVGGGSVTQDFPALSVVGNAGNHALITACGSGSVNPCDAFDAKFIVDGIGDVITHASIDADGNVDIRGQYQINGSCVLGCAHSRNTGSGTAVTRYVPTASVPSVEDYGEAQLVNGQATVHLGADFANVIDRGATYLVFITPEGDTNGVYVTQKTSGGFEVRENHGGHSSAAFQYRIVAKPYGATGSRLPMVNTRVHGFAPRLHA